MTTVTSEDHFRGSARKFALRWTQRHPPTLLASLTATGDRQTTSILHLYSLYVRAAATYDGFRSSQPDLLTRRKSLSEVGGRNEDEDEGSVEEEWREDQDVIKHNVRVVEEINLFLKKKKFPSCCWTP